MKANGGDEGWAGVLARHDLQQMIMSERQTNMS